MTMDVTIPAADFTVGTAYSILRDQQMEVLPFDAFVEFAVGMGNDAAELTKLNGTFTIYSGTDLLCQSAPIQKGSAFKYPDDFIYQDAALAQEKLSVVFTPTVKANPTANEFVRVTCRITPAGGM